MQALYKNIMREEISKKAECLYNIIGKSPGFDIVDAVKKIGGKVVFNDKLLPPGIDAKINTQLEDNTVDFEIICSDNNSNDYSRFCIAHELGHLFLHMVEKDEQGKLSIVKESYYKNNSANLREWEAEEFAACFLMPEDDLKAVIEECDGDVKKIAKIFKVSPQSVIMRCKRLEIIQ